MAEVELALRAEDAAANMDPEQLAVIVALMLVDKSTRLLLATPFQPGSFKLESPFNTDAAIVAVSHVVKGPEGQEYPTITLARGSFESVEELPADGEILGTLVLSPALLPVLLHDAENGLSVDALRIQNAIIHALETIKTVAETPE